MRASNVRRSATGRVVSLAAVAALALSISVATQGREPRAAAPVLVNGAEAVAGEVLVKFHRPLTPAENAEVDAQADADQNEGVGGIDVRRIHSKTFDTDTLLAFFRTDPRVAYVEPNYILHANAVPNDPEFLNLWGLLNTGQVIGAVAGVPGADIKAVPAWDLSTGSRANVVGVVDTGVDYTHPDLAANIWSAPAAFTVTIGSRLITCAAGTHGFNAITKTCDPMDDNYHGTHVSGTIGGVGNNGLGVVGVNWIASIMGLKFLDASGSGSTADAIDAIEFAIQAKTVLGLNANVRVLSNSWGGGPFEQAMIDEINRANTSEMLFVAAAGNASADNDVTPNYPSNYNAPNMVAVAATDNTDGLAYFSNYGRTTVHLGAPGQDILSTMPGGVYDYLSGTSMATPHVAGAAALVLSKCALNTATLKSTILGNVDPTLAGWVSSNGRLNVDKAIRACAAPATPNFALSATPASQTVAQGAGTSYTVAIARTGGFGSAAVALSVSGLPSGAAGAFNPNPTTANSSLTVTTAATTPVGTYALTLTGTSGSLTRTTSVTLVVAAPAAPNFTLSASPASQTLVPGASTTYAVALTRAGGFTGAVALSVSGLPSGAAGTFSPNPAAANSSTLTVTTSSTTPVGSYVVTLTGTSGSLVRTTSAMLVVTAASCTDGECP